MTDGSRILIADDHPLMRGALAHTVSGALPDTEVMEAGSLAQTLSLLSQNRGEQPIELVLLDLKMPGMNGFAGLLTLRAEFPEIPVIIVSASEDPATINRAVAYGAVGFIPKSATEDHIADAVRTVLAGGECIPEMTAETNEDGDEADFHERLSSLTPQQLKVLLYIADGKLNKQIAYEMKVTEATVKAHITLILRKLGVLSRTQAAIAARRFRVEGRF